MPISIRERRDRRTTLLSPLELDVELPEPVPFVIGSEGGGSPPPGGGGGGGGTPGGPGPAPDPGPDPTLSCITYSQSGVAAFQVAATNAGMTNGVFNKPNPGGQTAHEAIVINDGLTDIAFPAAWLEMDLGRVLPITSVVIGCDFNATMQREVLDFTLETGEVQYFGKKFAEELEVTYSEDGVFYFPAFNTGTFTQGIQTYATNFSARYIRIEGRLEYLYNPIF